MPIGDLLAQISGGDDGASPSPAQNLARSNTLPKRKADDDIRPFVPKAPRVTTLSTTVAPRTSQPPRPRPNETSSRPSQPSRPLDRPTPSQRPSNPINGGGSKPNVLSSRPMNGGNRISKPAPPSRPSPGPSNAPPAARGAPPKKGSFAEILARAQRAQATMGQVGKIQHKKVEGGNIKREKEEAKAAKADPRDAKKPARPGHPSGYSGTAKPGQRNGTPVNGQSRDPRNGRDSKAPPPAKTERGKVAGGKPSGGRAAAPAEEEKKVKKAVTATTGYTGTARPRPGAATKKKDVPPWWSSRFEDEYDEDMDDFIDYDDEEEDDGGPRYDYASDGSSDMEAGMDELDIEERRAEQIARREDIEEERLERKLKADKEARKRQAFEALRARRR
ncbi:hypothetical protein CEP54_001390 [Fusarium duplospermum]|uniref:SPT2 chromatin protein n=1 Tax=Fusarium duplospermum TaxID=1325734 RepID=A0A428R160_9HYPO|nr:hypothetical protein CEP54_001390 [Fusarium duplospermum]